MLLILPRDIIVCVLSKLPYRSFVVLRMLTKSFHDELMPVVEHSVGHHFGRTCSTQKLWLKVGAADYKLENCHKMMSRYFRTTNTPHSLPTKCDYNFLLSLVIAKKGWRTGPCDFVVALQKCAEVLRFGDTYYAQVAERPVSFQLWDCENDKVSAPDPAVRSTHVKASLIFYDPYQLDTITSLAKRAQLHRRQTPAAVIFFVGVPTDSRTELDGLPRCMSIDDIKMMIAREIGEEPFFLEININRNWNPSCFSAMQVMQIILIRLMQQPAVVHSPRWVVGKRSRGWRSQRQILFGKTRQ